MSTPRSFSVMGCIFGSTWVEWSIRRQLMVTSLGLVSITLLVVIVVSVSVILGLGSTVENLGRDAVVSNVEQTIELATSEYANLIHAKIKHGHDAVHLVALVTQDLLGPNFVYERNINDSFFDYDDTTRPEEEEITRVNDKLGSLESSTYYFPYSTPNNLTQHLGAEKGRPRDSVERTAYLDQTLKNVFKYNLDITSVYIGLKTGSMFRHFPGSIVDATRQYNPTVRPWYTSAVQADKVKRDSVTISDPYIDAFGLGAIVTIAKVIRIDGENEIRGVAGLDIRIKSMQDILAANSFLTNGYSAMSFVGSGVLLSHPQWDTNKELQKLEDSDVEGPLSLPENKNIRDAIYSGTSSLSASVLSDSSGISIDATYNRQGEIFYVAHTTQDHVLTKEFDLVLMTMAPESDVLSAIVTLKEDVSSLQLVIITWTLSTCLITAIVTAMALRLLVRKITAPLQIMTNVSEAILKGATEKENLGAYLGRSDSEASFVDSEAGEKESKDLEVKKRIRVQINELAARGKNARDEVDQLAHSFAGLVRGIRKHSRMSDIDNVPVNPLRGQRPLLSGSAFSSGASPNPSVARQWAAELQANTDQAEALTMAAVVDEQSVDGKKGRRALRRNLHAQLKFTVFGPLLLGIVLTFIVTISLLAAKVPSWVDGTSDVLYRETVNNLERITQTKGDFINQIFLQAQGDAELVANAAQDVLEGQTEALTSRKNYYSLGRTNAQRVGVVSEKITTLCNGGINDVIFPCQNAPSDFFSATADPYKRTDEVSSYVSSMWYSREIDLYSEVGDGDPKPMPDATTCAVNTDMQCARDLTSVLDQVLQGTMISNDLYTTVYYGQENSIMRSYPYRLGNDFHTKSFVNPCTFNSYDRFDPRQREWYCKSLSESTTTPGFGSVLVSEPYNDATTNDLLITLSKRVDANGQFTGVVGIDMEVETLRQSVLRTKILDNGYAFVVDRNLELAIGNKMPDAGLEFLDRSNLPSGAAVNSLRLANFTNDDGESWFAAVRSLPVSQFQVAIVVPESDILRTSTRVKAQIVNASLIASLVYVAVVILVVVSTLRVAKSFTETVVQPIDQMSVVLDEVTKRLGSSIDDVSLDISPSSKDVSMLHQTFTRLSTALRIGQQAFSTGQLADSLKFFEEANSRFSKMGNDRGVAICDTNIAMISHRMWEAKMRDDRQPINDRTLYAESFERYQRSLEAARIVYNASESDSNGSPKAADAERLASRIFNLILLLCDRINLEFARNKSGPGAAQSLAEAKKLLAELNQVEQSTSNLINRAKRSTAKAEVEEAMGRMSQAEAVYIELEARVGKLSTNAEWDSREGVALAEEDGNKRDEQATGSPLAVCFAPESEEHAVPVDIVSNEALVKSTLAFAHAKFLFRCGKHAQAFCMVQDVLTTSPVLSESVRKSALQFMGTLMAKRGDARRGSATATARVEEELGEIFKAEGISLLANGGKGKDIVFLLDTSGSMGGARISLACDGVISILQKNIAPGDQCAFYTFANTTSKAWSLQKCDRDKQAVEFWVDEVNARRKAAGLTKFFDSLKSCVEELQSKGNDSNSNWVIALTDGEDNRSSVWDLEKAGKELAKAGVNFCLITVLIQPEYVKLLQKTLVQPVLDASLQGMLLDVKSVEAISKAFTDVGKTLDNCRALEMESYS